MEQIIRVTGKGRQSVTPDQIRLLLLLRTVNADYSTAMGDAASSAAKLREALVEAGFSRESLKTLNFNISLKHESYQDKKGHWQNRFVGYEITQNLKVVFELDSTRLGQVLTVAAESGTNPQLDIQYTVRDAEAARTKALEAAVQDARAKAEVLAIASRVQLGELVTIDYSFEEVELTVRPYGGMDRMMLAENAKMQVEMEVEPDDIELTDTVTLVWRIAK